MSMSRTSMVFQSQEGDPFFPLAVTLASAAARRARGLIKRGASKIIQIATSPAGRAAIGAVGGGVVGAAAQRVFGGARPALPAGFTVLRASRPRAASPGGRPLQLLTAQGRIINLQRRRRGISATELRGFRKVVGLLHRVGMTPKRLGRGGRRRKGNPE